MLGRFSTALQHAAEVLAPPPPLFEDFVYYWKKLMNHYLDVTKTKPTLIELTNIPNHLEHLLQILIKEGETSDGAGACMEYFLQHNLLDLLTTLAATDDPPGMKQHVLQLVAKLLNQSKHIDFGHSSVYSALQRLIGLCDGSTPTASESYEIQFLLSLSGILRRNYQLVPVFISHSSNEGESSTERRTSCSSTSSDASSTPRNALFTTPLVPSARSCNVTLVPQPVTVCLGNSSQSDSHPQFPIADAVLSYLDSPDTGVRLKACQALMLLVSLPDGTNTASLISSEVSLRLISRLVLLFYTIPHSTDPSHIDEMHLSWGLDIPTNDCTGCNGCKQAATFLSWFDYCDQVMIEGNQSIADAVSQRFSESFLGQAFNSLALHKPINLTMLTKCFKMASSPLLNDALNEWFTCDSILNILLENWSSQDTDLAIETLRFFELILEKSSDYVLDCLIWRYLKERTFLNSYTSATGALSEDGGNLEINGGSEQEIYVIIKRWTNIVPKEIQSCNCGYEEYIGESMRQYHAVLSKVESQQNATQDLPSSDAEFNEGPFLSALFTALSNIPKQAYELNLELTGIVSRLALRPETYLTEYMLNNTKQLKVRSLYSVLMGVAAELGNCITQFPDYQKTLSDVRATLLGRSMASLELKPDPWIGTFESIVVVEELCKELAAISYVKLKANGA